MDKIWLFLYYHMARHLPKSHSKWGKITHSKKIRYFCCKHIFKFIGKNVNIEHGACFGDGKEIEIGDNSGIGVNAYILSNTKIGRDVMMGPNCYMAASTHIFDRTDIPMREQGRKKERTQVTIGDDVWIGRDVTIVGSRDIKNGSIVGARCLLSKSFPEYSIIGGNPARLIRSRK